MTEQDRAAAEAVIRASLAQYGSEVVSAVLAKIQKLPDTLDVSAFVAGVGGVVADIVREYVATEQRRLQNLNRGLDAMNVVFPRGPVRVS